MAASLSDVRIPGPFWVRQRPDERRVIDCQRKRKFGSVSSEVGEVIHGGPGEVGRRASDFRYPRRRPGPSSSRTSIPEPFWLRQRPDERREVDVLRKRKFDKNDYEVREVVHGGPSGGGKGGEVGRRHSFHLPWRCRRQSQTFIPGPFWTRDRPDYRREPDIDRRRKIEQRTVIPDVVHGEEGRLREWIEARDRRAEERRQIDPYDLPPGPSHADPFWMLERADERRDPDMDEKRKFERQVIKVAEIIHGEDFRTRYDPPRREELPNVLGPDPTDEIIESDEDEEESFQYKRACGCGPRPARSGPDEWMLERDWGYPSQGYSSRGYSSLGYSSLGHSSLGYSSLGYSSHGYPSRGYPSRGYQSQGYPSQEYSSQGYSSLPPDVEQVIREVPPARISCPPESEVANFDQPNAFMRQLYHKYPYLYQVLRETPPEELASRVFKDKFLSTYQVDYLHMGVGRERIPEGGARAEERIVNDDGEPEPVAIPGCSYRHGERGDFGKKKYENKKKEKEEPLPPLEQEVREEPRISEYMATISRLGNEIMTDQLYKVAQITKNMKQEYKKI